MLSFGTFLGKVFSKDRIPIADVLGRIVKGISQISRTTLLHVSVRPIDDEYRYYFGLAITSAEFLNFVQTNAGGSAQPQANPPLLGEFELSIPNKQSLPEFNTKISSFLGVIESNETEISKLHEVKDTMVKMLSSR